MRHQQERIELRMMPVVPDEDTVRLMLAVDVQVEANELGRRTDVEIDSVTATIGFEVEDDPGTVGRQLPVVLQFALLLEVEGMGLLEVAALDQDAADKVMLALGGGGAQVPAVFAVPHGVTH